MYGNMADSVDWDGIQQRAMGGAKARPPQPISVIGGYQTDATVTAHQRNIRGLGKYKQQSLSKART